MEAQDGAAQLRDVAQHLVESTREPDAAPGGGVSVFVAEAATLEGSAAMRRPLALALARPAPQAEVAAAPPAPAPGVQRDDAEVMAIAEWAYYHVEEVWSAFNLLAEGVARGFRVQAATPELQEEVEAWNARVRMPEQVRMWVKNALIYGRCIVEATKDTLEVHHPPSVELRQDAAGKLAYALVTTETDRTALLAEEVRVFTLHRLTTRDMRGVSALLPVLETLDDMLEARHVNRAVAKRYRAPIRVIELPHDATQADQQALASQLAETPPDMDMVLPPGARIHVLNHGKDTLQPDALMRDHLMDRIFLGLGVPKLALGVPDGSSQHVGEVQREMLLADKVAPYQRQVKEFAEAMYADLFGQKVVVCFDPVSVRDEKALAEVSRILVEAGIKTPAQVERHYWQWAAEG